MLAKRIVPCLDIKDGKTVKGINFVNFRDAGDRSNWVHNTAGREQTNWYIWI